MRNSKSNFNNLKGKRNTAGNFDVKQVMADLQLFQNSRDNGSKTVRTRSKQFQPKQRDRSNHSLDEKVNTKISEGIKIGFNALFDRIESFIEAKVDFLVSSKMKTFMDEQDQKSQKKQINSTLKLQTASSSAANSLKTFNLQLPGQATTDSCTRSSRQYCRSPLLTASGRMSTMSTINESKFEFLRRGSRQSKRAKEKLEVVKMRKDDESTEGTGVGADAAVRSSNYFQVLESNDNSQSKQTMSTDKMSKVKLYPMKSNFSSGNKIENGINTILVGDKGEKNSKLKSQSNHDSNDKEKEEESESGDYSTLKLKHQHRQVITTMTSEKKEDFPGSLNEHFRTNQDKVKVVCLDLLDSSEKYQSSYEKSCSLSEQLYSYHRHPENLRTGILCHLQSSTSSSFGQINAFSQNLKQAEDIQLKGLKLEMKNKDLHECQMTTCLMGNSNCENKSSACINSPGDGVVILSSSKQIRGNYNTQREQSLTKNGKNGLDLNKDAEQCYIDETIDNTSFTSNKNYRRRQGALLSTHAFISNDNSVDVQNQYYKMREPEGATSLTRQVVDNDPENIMDTKSQNLINEQQLNDANN